MEAQRRVRAEESEHDDRLMAACAAGDAQAFARIVDRHGPRLAAVVRRFAATAGDAEDIVQEAMLRAWQQAPRWQPGGAQLGTWLYRVATNLCIDRGRRKRPEPLEDVPEPIDPAPAALDRLEEAELQARLRRHIAALPERQAMALTLRYTAELSNAAAAEAMEISEGAFELLLVRARKKLRSMLAQEDEEDRR